MITTLKPQLYAFPALNNLDAVQSQAERGRKQQLEATLREAIANGFIEGVNRGRTEAQREAQQIREQSRGEGYVEGRAEGLAATQAAATALREGFAQFAQERAAVLAEAEAFCVDVALAAVARVVETNSARSEFTERMIRAALVALAPDGATAVFINPADHAVLGNDLDSLPLRDDETLVTGSARVEAGRLVVHSSIDDAFDQIRTAVMEHKAKRTGRQAKPKERNQK